MHAGLASRQRVVSATGQTAVHYWGRVGIAGATLPDARTFTRRSDRWGAAAVSPDDRCGLWRVTSYGQSFAYLAGGTGRSLTPGQIIDGSPAPANSRWTQRPVWPWLEIVVGPSSGRRYLVDAGQTIYVHADVVTVAFWLPGPAASLGTWLELPYSTAPVAVPVTEDLVLEGLLDVEIARVEDAPSQGQDFALLSGTYYQAAGSHLVVDVPPGARRVSIARDAAGAVVDSYWEYIVGDPAFGALSLDAIPIVQRQSVDSPAIRSNATAISAPLLPEDAVWNVHWEIET